VNGLRQVARQRPNLPLGISQTLAMRRQLAAWIRKMGQLADDVA
jgi:hypothetical protein